MKTIVTDPSVIDQAAAVVSLSPMAFGYAAIVAFTAFAASKLTGVLFD